MSEYGVTVTETGEVARFRTEEELYEHLGYAYIRPSSVRTAASSRRHANGELPALVELEDLRGDLHSHSTWSSDGHDSIEAMARAAMERGYEYLGLTDHSHYLRGDRLERQSGRSRRSTSAWRRFGSCVASR